MKIHVVTDAPSIMPNPYVGTLMNEIKESHPEITISYGIDEFWMMKHNLPDILHIHWPDLLLIKEGVPQSPDDVEQRLDWIKHQGVRIVLTCHNFVPHYTEENSPRIKMYEIARQKADMIIHLGEFSYHKQQQELPNKLQVVIPHHVYDTYFKIEDFLPLQLSVIRKQWNIPAQGIVILSFGSFRSEEERKLLFEAMDYFRKREIYFIAPQFFRVYRRRNILAWAGKYLKAYYLKKMYPHLRFVNRFIPDNEIPALLSITDIVLLQRVRILNSGNLPLAYLFGKTVVGPNMGNVGEILSNTDNPVFDPYDISTVNRAIEEALRLSKSDLGVKNKIFALKEWSTHSVAAAMYRAYQTLLSYPDVKK